MRAHDLVEQYPTLDVSASAEEAARLIGNERRPALLVLDGDAVVSVLPASQVVALLIPPYLREDPSLVRVYDEKTADACVQRLAGRTVGDLIPPDQHTHVPVIDASANLLECAALMARENSPLIVVTAPAGVTGADLDDADRDDDTESSDNAVVLGVITASRLLDTLLP